MYFWHQVDKLALAFPCSESSSEGCSRGDFQWLFGRRFSVASQMNLKWQPTGRSEIPDVGLGNYFQSCEPCEALRSVSRRRDTRAFAY